MAFTAPNDEHDGKWRPPSDERLGPRYMAAHSFQLNATTMKREEEGGRRGSVKYNQAYVLLLNSLEVYTAFGGEADQRAILEDAIEHMSAFHQIPGTEDG